jgi:site-specific recombinase XerD
MDRHADNSTEDRARKARKLPKVIDRDEVRSLMGTINTKCPTGLRNMAALMLMYRAGLRVSEVCNLSQRDVNLKDGFVYVQLGKGSKDRVVPLDPTVVEWLTKWAAVRPDSTYFICTLKGGRVSDRYLRAVCYRLSERAGVYIEDNHERKPIHPHTLRHCFGTELVEENYTLPEIKELMGHTDINTTSIYLSVRPEHLARKIRGRT